MARAPAVGDSTPIWNPAVIFEVFSDESVAPDLVTVDAESAPMPSVRHSIVLAQNVMASLRADSFARMGETGIERPLDGLCERIDVAAPHSDAVAAD